jgi:hypothetical protein
MILNGRKNFKPNEKKIVLPRDEGPIVFTARGVPSMKAFHEMVPDPKPGTKMLPNVGRVDDFNDAVYKAAMLSKADKRYAYMCIQSLAATEGLVWERVQPGNPDTWLAWEQEMLDSGITETELNYIQNVIIEVNSLSQEKLDEARNAFLASLEAATKTPQSQTDEQLISQSGLDVNALV